MTPAIFDTVRADIVARQYVFRATGSNLKFQGFYAVWPREEDERLLPVMQVNEVLDEHGLKPEQHFTQPPPRFSEASLIKELEEQGIGRPSTYVPIISTIQDRGYVDQEQRRFVPTWLGETINEVMNKHFPDIVDSNFTADMERKLDDVENGKRSWTEFLSSFYGDFKATMKKAEAEMDRVEKPLEETEGTCPDCGRSLVIRTGRFGRFISCSGFPECEYRRSFVNKTGALCPLCHGDIVERKTRQKKRVFYGCGNYPTCSFAIWEHPVADVCPKCGGLMVVPKVGQDPVCYNEVIAVQRSTEAKPMQKDEKAPTRTMRKKTTASPEASPVDEATPVKARRVATKKTTALAEGEGEQTGTTTPATARRAAAKRTTTSTKGAAKTTTPRTRKATGTVTTPKRGTKAAK
jgi:DNA topoisomerase-1